MGAGISRIGQGWQPCCGAPPGRQRRPWPCDLTPCVAAILNGNKPRVMRIVAPHGHGYEPEYANTGQFLYIADSASTGYCQN
jgi:hypothetical protein